MVPAKQDLDAKVGDNFLLDIMVRWRTPAGTFEPVDLSGVEEVEFSLGVDPGKKTHTYLSTMDPARVWLETEVLEDEPGHADGTYYVVKANIPPSENRAWPKPKQGEVGLWYELSLQWAPDDRRSPLGGFIVIDPEVANETLVTP